MLRLIAFFFAVLLLLRVMQMLPGVGGLFHGFIGFWLVAIGLSIALARWSSWWSVRRRVDNQLRALGHVDNPHNRGKRGVLRLAGGQARAAIDDLEAAVRGEPEVVEWRYRLALARLAVGDAREAADHFQAAEALAPDHAYGGVQLGLARAQTRIGRHEHALAALDRFERDRGPTPESAYLRGTVLKRMGRGGPARESFASISELLAKTPGFQRRNQRIWWWRALLARFAP